MIASTSNLVIDFTFFHHNQLAEMIKIIDDLLRHKAENATEKVTVSNATYRNFNTKEPG